MPILFFAFWIILNGKVTLEICVFGAVISALVFLFAWKFLGYSLKKEIKEYRFIGMYLAYAGIVIREIFKANIDVMKIVLNRKYKPEPQLVTFTTELRSEGMRVALANSITLTPGTISVSLEDNKYIVHCLDKSFAEGLEDSCFVKYLMKIEAKKNNA